MLWVFLCACSGDSDAQLDATREVVPSTMGDTITSVDSSGEGDSSPRVDGTPLRDGSSSGDPSPSGDVLEVEMGPDEDWVDPLDQCPPANLMLGIWSASGPLLEKFVGVGTIDHGERRYTVDCAESGSTHPEQFTCEQVELPGGWSGGALSLTGDFGLEEDWFLIDVSLTDASGNYFKGELIASRGSRYLVPEPDADDVRCPFYWASIVLRDPSNDVVCTDDAPVPASPSNDTCIERMPGLTDTCADAAVICAEGEYHFGVPYYGQAADDYAWPCGCGEAAPGQDGRGLVDGVVAFIPPASGTYRLQGGPGIPGSYGYLYVVTECGSAAPACLAAGRNAEVELVGGLKYYIILDGIYSNQGGALFQFNITRL